MSRRLKAAVIKPTKCPYCGSEDTVYSPPKINRKKKYHCNGCGRAFWG